MTETTCRLCPVHYWVCFPLQIQNSCSLFCSVFFFYRNPVLINALLPPGFLWGLSHMFFFSLHLLSQFLWSNWAHRTVTPVMWRQGTNTHTVTPLFKRPMNDPPEVLKWQNIVLQKSSCAYLPFLSRLSNLTNSSESIRKTLLATSCFMIYKHTNPKLGCRKSQVFAWRSTLGLLRNEKSELSLNVRESQTTFECVSLICQRKSHFKQTEQVSLSR